MTLTQSLKQVDKDVARAVTACLAVDKANARIKKLEQQLAEARRQECKAYCKANDTINILADNGLDWAAYEIQEALQQGKTVEMYLAELFEDNRACYNELVKTAT